MTDEPKVARQIEDPMREDAEGTMRMPVESESQPPPDAPDLSAGAILACAGQDGEMARTYVPEWGGWVYARPWTGAQRKQWGIRCMRAYELKGPAGDRKMELLTAELLALSLCDSEGHMLFKLEDAAKINELLSLVLSRLESWVQDLNGLGKASVDAAEGN